MLPYYFDIIYQPGGWALESIPYVPRAVPGLYPLSCCYEQYTFNLKSYTFCYSSHFIKIWYIFTWV